MKGNVAVGRLLTSDLDRLQRRGIFISLATLI